MASLAKLRSISTVLWWVGLAGFALPLLVITGMTPMRPVRVVAGIVVESSVLVVVVGAVISALCWISWLLIVRAVRRSVTGGNHSDAGSSPRPLAISMLRRLRAVFIAAVMVAGVYCITFSDRYRVLEPASARGCLIVVSREPGEIFDAAGKIYLLNAGSGLPVDTGGRWFVSNRPDADPIKDGTWSLRWDGDNAQLRIWSKGSYSFDLPAAPITCVE
jgi:hypothetical protein